ncbi:MAG TPA: TIGR02530 family flagellar biosynthesis protein [Candidatus Baltobacteraceae bacterium]|nr:TIGR02530 family flagellar biosynthesis protein [Candidatus Baltobacteraceae bacterium]
MADPRIEGLNVPPAVSPVRPQGVPVQVPPAGGSSFRDVLRSTTSTAGQPLKFSAHAQQRLASRNITLSSDDVAKMNAMADQAAAKGAKQSLFMMRDVAMVVSIQNRTVITAVDQSSMKNNVFTNIDSAAIIG